MSTKTKAKKTTAKHKPVKHQASQTCGPTPDEVATLERAVEGCGPAADADSCVGPAPAPADDDDPCC